MYEDNIVPEIVPEVASPTVPEVAEMGPPTLDKSKEEPTITANEPKKEEQILIAGDWHSLTAPYPWSRVFVYGTLKFGHHNHHKLGESSKLLTSNAYLDDYCMMMDGYLPVIFKHNNYSVTGAVYQVNEEILAVIDNLEGVSNGLYNKHIVYVTIPISTKKLPCFAYTRFPPIMATYKHVPSGIYSGANTYTQTKDSPDIDGVPKLTNGVNLNEHRTPSYFDEDDRFPRFPIGLHNHAADCPCYHCVDKRRIIADPYWPKRKASPPLIDPVIFLWGTPYVDDGKVDTHAKEGK